MDSGLFHFKKFNRLRVCVWLMYIMTGDLVLQEHKKWAGYSERDAKVKYTQQCRALKTYGITFFLVKVSTGCWYQQCCSIVISPTLSEGHLDLLMSVRRSVWLKQFCDKGGKVGAFVLWTHSLFVIVTNHTLPWKRQLWVTKSRNYHLLKRRYSFQHQVDTFAISSV